MMREHKISFCTVCMNRLHHLKQTLPVNIRDNENYPNLEFILLDYNSDDGLEEYIKENFNAYLTTDKLIYYRTTAPQYFDRSHSRNMVHNLATGDIICNLDADNYTGTGFAAYINDEFKKHDNIFLTPIGGSQKRDVLGRTCVKKNDFYAIGGYDERMTSYGFEDFDLINRLELLGLTKLLFNIKLDAIEHEEAERLSNEFLTGNLEDFYINYLTPSSTDFLFLFNNNTYKKGILIDNATQPQKKPAAVPRNQLNNYTHSILEDEWIEGNWSKNKNEILLKPNNTDSETLALFLEEDCLINNVGKTASRFHKLSDPQLLQDTVMFLSQITNRIIMEKNIIKESAVVNSGNFGKGIVYKNFDYQSPITI